MRIASLVLLTVLGSSSFAENMPRNDEEFFRMMRAKAEAEQMEAEYKDPKKPEITADRAVVGPRNAKIQVVEYSDFQCPYCKKGWETANELKKKYKDKMVLIFKHLPLQFHPLAMPAAKRFEAIALQSAKKAYEFHDEIFKNQEQLTSGGEAFLDGIAKKIKINVEKMKKDMESEKVKKRIEADMAEAAKFGIQGTPGFVVMGVTLKGAYPIEAFENIIQRRTADKKG
jgi:protein-disulfide isomerase